MTTPATIPANRIVVLMPNWLGDAVMATPFLRALHSLYPTAHIAAVARPLIAPVLAGLPWVHETFIAQKNDDKSIVRFLRQNPFDLGILLPNSFRSAYTLFRGRVKTRLGYARELRSPLLTHKLKPQKRTPLQRTLDQKKSDAISQISGHKEHPKVGSPYQPLPTITYYLELAKFLGAQSPSQKMELAITDSERTEAESLLASLSQDSAPKTQDFITLVPGANFGSSKCWPPDRFAQVADRLIDSQNVTIFLASSPAELPIIEAIIAASKNPTRLIPLAKHNLSLGALKELVRRAILMLANDTGPRHFALALGTPVVTLFGPTDPLWAETFAAPSKEIQLRIEVPCGPCQLKKCPIDHRCMNQLTPAMVLDAIQTLAPGNARPVLTTQSSANTFLTTDQRL